MPLLLEFNPNLYETFANTIKVINDDYGFIENEAEKTLILSQKKQIRTRWLLIGKNGNSCILL